MDDVAADRDWRRPLSSVHLLGHLEWLGGERVALDCRQNARWWSARSARFSTKLGAAFHAIRPSASASWRSTDRVTNHNVHQTERAVNCN